MATFQLAKQRPCLTSWISLGHPVHLPAQHSRFTPRIPFRSVCSDMTGHTDRRVLYEPSSSCTRQSPINHTVRTYSTVQSPNDSSPTSPESRRAEPEEVGVWRRVPRKPAASQEAQSAAPRLKVPWIRGDLTQTHQRPGSNDQQLPRPTAYTAPPTSPGKTPGSAVTRWKNQNGRLGGGNRPRNSRDRPWTKFGDSTSLIPRNSIERV